MLDPPNTMGCQWIDDADHSMTWSIVSTKSEEDERRVRGVVHYTFTFWGA